MGVYEQRTLTLPFHHLLLLHVIFYQVTSLQKSDPLPYSL